MRRERAEPHNPAALTHHARAALSHDLDLRTAPALKERSLVVLLEAGLRADVVLDLAGQARHLVLEDGNALVRLVVLPAAVEDVLEAGVLEMVGQQGKQVAAKVPSGDVLVGAQAAVGDDGLEARQQDEQLPEHDAVHARADEGLRLGAALVRVHRVGEFHDGLVFLRRRAVRAHAAPLRVLPRPVVARRRHAQRLADQVQLLDVRGDARVPHKEQPGFHAHGRRVQLLRLAHVPAPGLLARLFRGPAGQADVRDVVAEVLGYHLHDFNGDGDGALEEVG